MSFCITHMLVIQHFTKIGYFKIWVALTNPWESCCASACAILKQFCRKDVKHANFTVLKVT